MNIFKNNGLFAVIVLLLASIAGCSTLSDTSSDELSLTTPRYGHAVVNDGNKIYVIAGANKENFLSDIEIIDPATGKIKVLAKHVIPRRYFTAVWDGKHSIYILGGVSIENNTFRYEKRVEVFNTLTNEVTFAKPLPMPTRINSAVIFEEKIFVFGGAYPKKGKLTPTALVVLLDLKRNKWIRAADMPTAKSTRAVLKDEYIYVVGGYDRISSLNSFERFDPKKNQWTTLPSLPVNISAHSVSLVNNKLFVFGDYNNLTSTYSYDFSTEQWQKIDINYQASRHNAATTLGDNTYVIGGNIAGNGPFLDLIQVFKL